MRELQAATVKIPDDFSVIGFDNIFGSDFTTPALTTIASPFSEAGIAALSLILAALPSTEASPPPAAPLERAALPTSLIVRGSSGRLLAT